MKETEAEEFYEDSDDVGESIATAPKILAKKESLQEFTPSKGNPLVTALENFPP